MAFRDELVRCAACGNQFVYTVREQRRRQAKGLPTEAPAFCDECRGADVRLANTMLDEELAAEADDLELCQPPVAQELGASRDQRPSAGGGRGRKTDDAAPEKRRATGSRGRSHGVSADSGRARGRAGAGVRGEGAKSRSRKSEPPRQTELRVRYLGTVKWFDEDRGFGFIAQEDGEELFVHSRSVLIEGSPTLVQGQEVEYEVARTARGPQAVDVVPVE